MKRKEDNKNKTGWMDEAGDFKRVVQQLRELVLTLRPPKPSRVVLMSFHQTPAKTNVKFTFLEKG